MSGHDKPAVLLLNVGSPDAPTAPALRRYLRTFLDDPRVVDLPLVVRKILVHLLDRKSTRLNSSH